VAIAQLTSHKLEGLGLALIAFFGHLEGLKGGVDVIEGSGEVGVLKREVEVLMSLGHWEGGIA